MWSGYVLNVSYLVLKENRNGLEDLLEVYYKNDGSYEFFCYI